MGEYRTGFTRIKLTLAYVGTAFSGWQIQGDGPHRPRTVQGELEAALTRLTGLPMRVHGAGRTDAGVHADMQAAHFDVPAKLARINWPLALRGLLPDDLVILGAEEVPPDFHARFSAAGKIYAYAFSLDSVPLPPRWGPFVWRVGPLDLRLMDEAAAALLGEHDFAAFQNSGHSAGNTVRRLDELVRLPLCPSPEPPDFPPGRYWFWRFTGNGFLKQMVRNLMGFLVEAGRGRLRPADAAALFAAGKRKDSPFPTAPAHGLTLIRVLY
ncbi:MAG: tRNA pseudouridine(38-40) synthase TruA [Deltaproteobacteria bacterium]|nr:tRNA pseudouridine(38-40) synthase TruA [Deltaproteobacteria bacterium]